MRKQIKQSNHLVLIINTAIFNKISIILFDKVKFKKKKIKAYSDKLLFLIDKMLRGNKLKMSDVKGVVVVMGQGSFTAVRNGVVVGNTLGFTLGVPVADVTTEEFKNDQELIKISLEKLKKAKVGKFIMPFYEKEPNITKSKKFIF